MHNATDSNPKKLKHRISIVHRQQTVNFTTNIRKNQGKKRIARRELQLKSLFILFALVSTRESPLSELCSFTM